MNEAIKEIYVAALVHKDKLDLHELQDGSFDVEVILNYEELSYRYRLPKPMGDLKNECVS